MPHRHWDLNGVFIGEVDGQPINCHLRMRFTEHGTQWMVSLDEEATMENTMTYVGLDSKHRARRLISQMVGLLKAAPDAGNDAKPGGKIIHLDAAVQPLTHRPPLVDHDELHPDRATSEAHQTA